MEEKVIEIIEKVTGFKNLKENRDIDLLKNEILDSLAFVELITSLEEEFKVEIQPTLVSPETWRKTERIVDLVKSLYIENHQHRNLIHGKIQCHIKKEDIHQLIIKYQSKLKMKIWK